MSLFHLLFEEQLCYRILDWIGWKVFQHFIHVSSHCHLASMVSEEKWTINFIDDPLYVMNLFSLSALKTFSLFLSFNSLIIVCLGVNIYEFILFEVCWVSSIFGLIFFINFGEIGAIIYLIVFPVCSHFSFWDSHYEYVDVPASVCSFFFIFSFCSSVYITSINLCSIVLTFLPAQICYCVLLVNFNFSNCTFQFGPFS